MKIKTKLDETKPVGNVLTKRHGLSVGVLSQSGDHPGLAGVQGVQCIGASSSKRPSTPKSLKLKLPDCFVVTWCRKNEKIIYFDRCEKYFIFFWWGLLIAIRPPETQIRHCECHDDASYVAVCTACASWQCSRAVSGKLRATVFPTAGRVSSARGLGVYGRIFSSHSAEDRTARVREENESVIIFLRGGCVRVYTSITYAEACLEIFLGGLGLIFLPLRISNVFISRDNDFGNNQFRSNG